MATTPSSNILDFLVLVHNLKSTKRTGWIRKGVKDPESISDHMYMMSLMAWLAAPSSPTLNKDKCIKIALVHDLAECIVGDITPSDPISKEEKSKRELEAIHHLKEVLGPSCSIADEFVALWSEYENASSPEAILIKQIDKLEMIIQAFIYEQRQEIDLTEFYNSVESKLTDPTLLCWCRELIDRRIKLLPHLPVVKSSTKSPKPETS